MTRPAPPRDVLGDLARWGRAAAGLAVAMGAAVSGFVLLIVFLVGLVLLPVFGLGVPVLAGSLEVIRRLAQVHRRKAGQPPGTPMDAIYTSAPGWEWHKLRTCLRDPQTWRDVVWLAVRFLLAATTAGVGFGLYIGSVAPLQGGVGWMGVLTLPALIALAILWWGVPWVLHLHVALARLLLAPSDTLLRSRVAQLTESRAATVDAQAAELRRIERDLHDGAQARLAAVSITLGLAAQVLRTDPERAGALLAEARADAGTAQSELRDLVRGIHPPVLADRGLAGGLEAAALLCPVPVRVEITLPHRPQAPVESALYFAATEALTNVGRHAGASTAWLRAGYRDGTLSVLVGDDGRGGADPAAGTGLRGIERRLAAFDGTATITSPPGGPTEIRMELPCPLSEPSSPRTTSSSGTG